MKYIGLILAFVLVTAAAEPNLFYKVNRGIWEDGWIAGARAAMEIIKGTDIAPGNPAERLARRFEADWQNFMTNTTEKMGGTNYFKK